MASLASARKPDQKCTLLGLPDQVLAGVFTYLSPADLIVLEAVCRRLQRVARTPDVLHFTSFHFTHPPELFAEFVDAVRAWAIVELDINNCVQLDAVVIGDGLRLCVNLTTLRCINAKVLPSTLLALAANELSKLTCLEWSLYRDRRAHTKLLLNHLKRNEVTLGLQSLQRMYVEVAPKKALTDFLVYVLKRCPSIVSVHLHEQNRKRQWTRLLRLTLETYVKRKNWKVFTYTTDRVRSTRRIKLSAQDEPPPVANNLIKACRADVIRYGNVSVIQKPRSSVRSCAKLDSCTIPTTEGLTQLLLCLEHPLSWARLREMATRNGNLCELRALTLVTALGPRAKIIPAEVTLGQFVSACSGLRELNLASFHVGEFDCCEALSQAVVPHLRSLSLPACALSTSTRLPQLVSASFRLSELDVRGHTSHKSGVCTACGDNSTCTSECLYSLHALCPLERLTLCDLRNVDTLDFLLDCSVAELRLGDLGPWCLRNLPSLSPLQELCSHLRCLTLHSVRLPDDLRFLNQLQPAPSLRRLCVAVRKVSVDQRAGLLDFLQRTFPNAHTLHVHSLARDGPHFELVWTRLPNEDVRTEVLPTDKMQLCRTCDYTGLQKPFLGQSKYAHL
ncbi:uncharacterized protein [Dermacentor albipictus]|uniref:uncharacterized protein n=1 Tax=Dermacentor albipictus TaxID=60249 RepID=UPI0031FDABF6